MKETIFQVTKRPSGHAGEFRHMTKLPSVAAGPFCHVTKSVGGVKKSLFRAAGEFFGVKDDLCRMKI